MDLNSVNISGWLSRDPELKNLPGGSTVCEISVAVNGIKQDDVTFVECALFGKVAEAAGQHLGKGQQVIIQGRLKQERWEGRDGKRQSRMKIIGSSCIFLGGSKTAKRAASPQPEDVPADHRGHPADGYQEIPI